MTDLIGNVGLKHDGMQLLQLVRIKAVLRLLLPNVMDDLISVLLYDIQFLHQMSLADVFVIINHRNITVKWSVESEYPILCALFAFNKRCQFGTPIETIVAVLDSFGANDPLGGYTLQNAECPPGWHIRTGLWKLLIK